MSDKPSIFISYSHLDAEAMSLVSRHLRPLERYGSLECWHDQKMSGGDAWREEMMSGGDAWREEIKRQLDKCSLAILLLSVDFLNSDFIQNHEIRRMLERHARDQLRIYPIRMRSCYQKAYPWLEQLNQRPACGTWLMEADSAKQEPLMTAIVAEIDELLAKNAHVQAESESPKGEDETRTASTDAITLTARDEQPVQGLQDWGKPFEFDPPKPLPAEDPAPPPPALISIPKPAGQLEAFGVEIPVSFLLQPENRIVPFLPSAMGWRDEIFGWAHLQDRPLKLRLQAGAGGTGKTRLAIDVCETLADEGWFAGLLPSSFEKADVERDLPTLLAGDRDCFFVIDYAETRADVVVTLARQLLIAVERMIEAQAPRRRFRIVMLAREGGDWFNQLAERATRASDGALKALLTAGATKSGPHRMSVRPIALGERRRIFAGALTAFSEKTGLSTDGVGLPDLDAVRFDRVLMIQMAALAKLCGDSTEDGQDLLDNTLGHERRYWRKLLDLEDGADDAPLKTFEQGLALLTLLGGRDNDAAAKDVIARVPRLRNLGAEAELSMFDRLRRFYPNRKDGNDAPAAGSRAWNPTFWGSGWWRTA